MMEAAPALRPEMRGRHGSFPNDGHVGGAEEEAVGCKAAVEIVSRNSQKGECLGFRVGEMGWADALAQCRTISTRMGTWSRV